jgi:peptidoglycan/xylan/chitin deacetylase (PgdA/CDA1 family)
MLQYIVSQDLSQPVRLQRLSWTALFSVTILSVGLLLLPLEAVAQKQICITFDELPAARSFDEVDRLAINRPILEALKKHGVKATGFVVGEQIEGAYDVLGEWLNQGHRLGNQTWSGQDYNELSPEQFLGDVRKGGDALEPMLSGFGQKKRYFRYPFLHYGDTPERRKAVGSFLEDRGYIVAPATVIPEDYLYNLNLLKLGKQPDSAKFDRLLNDYINSVIDELERVERVGKNLVSRPVIQILILRANQLNAACLEEMLKALEASGYKYLSLDDALKDDVYKIPEAYYGLKGLGYLDMIQESNPDMVPAK